LRVTGWWGLESESMDKKQALSGALAAYVIAIDMKLAGHDPSESVDDLVKDFGRNSTTPEAIVEVGEWFNWEPILDAIDDR